VSRVEGRQPRCARRPVGPEQGKLLERVHACVAEVELSEQRRSRERQSKKKGPVQGGGVCIIILSGAIASATGPVHTGRRLALVLYSKGKCFDAL
jgi:predicted amidohydrolase YtcJ